MTKAHRASDAIARRFARTNVDLSAIPLFDQLAAVAQNDQRRGDCQQLEIEQRVGELFGGIRDHQYQAGGHADRQTQPEDRKIFVHRAGRDTRRCAEQLQIECNTD
jgi:hypothetical protein